jgi:hypothetical protein
MMTRVGPSGLIVREGNEANNVGTSRRLCLQLIFTGRESHREEVFSRANISRTLGEERGGSGSEIRRTEFE